MENILFKLSDVYNVEKIKIPFDVSEEIIIGGIILNRIVGIAYNNLDLSELNNESRKSLMILKRNCEDQYEAFMSKLDFLSKILNNVDFKYGFLKGAFLSPVLYKKGMRNSNDIDILINESDISKLQIVLRNNGFIQGFFDNAGNIIPATRRDIVNSRLNYGETVPFVRYFNGDKFEVDINFSLDFKANGTSVLVKDFLKNTQWVNVGDFDIQTLSIDDFLLHLCCHLYKEATTYDWVINRRDLMLYKFSDINVFLHTYGNEKFFHCLMEKIVRYGVQNECYFSLYYTSFIYPNILKISGFEKFIREIKPRSNEYMKQIYFPRRKQIYYYEVDFEDWFNASNRLSLLKEKHREECNFE